MSSTDTAATSGPRPKQRRITRACDYCHSRSIRCQPTVGGGEGCQNCKDFMQPCTYRRRPRRRGVAPRKVRQEEQLRVHPPPVEPSTLPQHSPCEASVAVLPRQSWRAPYVASQAAIMDLVEVYFEIVYPIFPLFHQPSFIRRISRAEYTTSKSIFATTMAVCALVRSRVRDGSVTNPHWDLQSLQEVPPDAFYRAAEAQLEHGNTPQAPNLDILRAHAILAITSIQNGRVRDMQQHMGMYHTLVAIEGLHDESNWPPDMGIIEREERRRLFWSIYTLDVYTAVVWGGVVRSREQLSNVAYPTEVDDELIDDTSISTSSPALSSGISPSQDLQPRVHSDCWLSGWNFITDLYRVLEHALVRFRRHRKRGRQRSLHDIFGDQSSVTETSVREGVMEMYLKLPRCFKETPPMTYNVKQDRFGFQAANIAASLQLVRIVLFTAGGASIEERCQIASEVVHSFLLIPVAYLLAIGAPLLHHLGSIGAILGSVFEEPLSEADYTRVRSIMLSMAQLVENLEVINQSESASQKLRTQISRIDEYMDSQRGDNTFMGTVTDTAAAGTCLTVADDTTGSAAFHQDAEGSRDWLFQVPQDLLDELSRHLEFGQS
ncbi:fungal-specific transcription factor domain-containing protein [Stachybotrys elegans]|uniref:Fungal-specific transcription factor domain-containing protein n=1 Tax=Stachybotrys elegans TaxID=80388 RepID=A0A8K0S838_9HYPO|nr:fungal-specific transcription factor domain-containing protein [Stachybotrys elegans]